MSRQRRLVLVEDIQLVLNKIIKKLYIYLVQHNNIFIILMANSSNSNGHNYAISQKNLQKLVYLYVYSAK